MAMSAAALPHPPSSNGTPFRHEAFLHRNDTEYTARLGRFVHEAIEAKEPLLVAVPGGRLDLLRRTGSISHPDVQLVDVADVGSNPARIIGVWNDFLDRVGDRSSRGISEPVYAGRDDQQLMEYLIHERLLNVAFAARQFHLLCPYDAVVLGEDALDCARSSHPWVTDRGDTAPGERSGTAPESGDVFSAPLPSPPLEAHERSFTAHDLAFVRRAARSAAEAAGVDSVRLPDIELSVDEVATNAVTHGGSRGVARWWTEGGWFVCEISAGGAFTDPLVGRRRPRPEEPHGRGVWLAMQLCDLVQLRNVTVGTVVRLHVDCRPPG